jgi:hypothetical protein
MSVKKYDERDGEYGAEAECFIKEYFKKNSYTVTSHPNGIYKEDLRFETEYEFFYVEVERCGIDRWPAGRQFPFSTVNVPMRRQVTSNRIFLTVQGNLQQAIVMFPDDLKVLEACTKNNKHVTGERFRQCPIERCLPLDLTQPVFRSLAAMNAERVRKTVNDMTKTAKLKMRVLRGENREFSRPYGLELDDWRELICFVEKVHGLHEYVSTPMENRQATFEF